MGLTSIEVKAKTQPVKIRVCIPASKLRPEKVIETKYNAPMEIMNLLIIDLIDAG